jgi:predicted component of type VI protein secretion system
MSYLTKLTQGELAIRARLKAARAAAEKPESLNEAVSNKMDELLAKRDAETYLKLPEDLVKSCGEVIQQDFRLPFIVDSLQNPTMINVIASERRLDYAACVRSGVAELAVDAAESVQAANSLEKMLCHQMAAAHCAAMKLIARGLDGLDGSLPPVEMARLSNAAARMMQVYQEALLTLQRIRTGGKQTVVVQHVQVSDGGQAVIAGSMKSGEGV